MSERVYLDRNEVLRTYRDRLVKELAEVDALLAVAAAELELSRHTAPAPVASRR